MSEQLLGELSQIAYNEVVIREEGESAGDAVSQVNCFVTQDECESISLGVGTLAEVELECRIIPNHGEAWFAADIWLQ